MLRGVELAGMDALAPVIAIDGTAGSGKGTVASILARRLGFHLLESGRIYRAAGMMALRIIGDNVGDNAPPASIAGGKLAPPPCYRKRGVDIDDVGGLSADSSQLAGIAEDAARRLIVAIDESGGKSLARVLDTLFAGDDLDSEMAGKAASMLASVGAARVALLPLQRAARMMPGLVAEGRDMGTVVFADAAVKLYLDADIDIRAARRVKQLQNRGVSAIMADVRAGLAARDDKDKSRECAPLRLDDDAVVMDSGTSPAQLIADKAAHLFLAARANAGA